MHFQKPVGIAVLLLGLLTSLSPVYAGPKHPVKTVEAPYSSRITLDQCDLRTALIMLAHEARVDITVDPLISGTVAIQMEDVTAKQAITVLAQSNKLALSEINGAYFVRPTPETDQAHKSGKVPEDPFSNMIGEAVTQGVAKVADASLDYWAKPETAGKMAKVKRNYYLALTKEGFTANEALKIVLEHNSLDLPDEGGKTK